MLDIMERKKRKRGNKGRNYEEWIKVGSKKVENQREDEKVSGRYGKKQRRGGN